MKKILSLLIVLSMALPFSLVYATDSSPDISAITSLSSPDLPSDYKYYTIAFNSDYLIDSTEYAYVLYCSQSAIIFQEGTNTNYLTSKTHADMFVLYEESVDWELYKTSTMIPNVNDVGQDDYNMTVIYSNANVNYLSTGDAFFLQTSLSSSLNTQRMFSPLVQYLAQIMVLLIPLMIILVFGAGYRKYLRRLLSFLQT